jgi:hypothetical protein
MDQGLIDAESGGGVVKKRIGLAGRGKRGGARTRIATNKGNRWFFVYGFEKMSAPTLPTMNLRHFKVLLRSCWPCQRLNSIRLFKTQR